MKLNLKYRLVSLGVVFIFLLNGCAASFNGAIRKPMTAIIPSAKYNMRAAIVLSNELRSLQFTYGNTYFKVYPDMIEVFNQALRDVFSEVRVIDEKGVNKEDFDILLYLALDGDSSGVKVKWQGINPNSNKQIFIVEEKGFIQCTFDPKSGTGLLLAMTVILLPLAFYVDEINASGYYEKCFSEEVYIAAKASVDAMKNNLDLQIFAISLQKDEKENVAQMPLPKKVHKQTPITNINNIPVFENSSREDDFAVVIGIEKYQDSPMSEFSKSDAGIVKSYFKALGFKERNIELITDEKATRSGIEKAIEAWLPNKVKKNSKVYVYYSGHGAPEPTTGEAYIVPYDGDPNYLSITGYPLKRLYDRLGKLQAQEVVVLLDSCFSGSGGRSVLAKGARPLVMLPGTTVLPANMVVLTATQGSQISTSSPEKEHGVFTYYFLQALKDGKKELSEIYDYIKPLIEDEAKLLNVSQSPSITPESAKIKGKFSLRP